METAGFAAAVLIGLSLGLIGGGGSILTVPILVYFFNTGPVIATTYSLFVVGLTSAAGALSHYHKRNVNVKIAMIFGIPSLIAVLIMRRWVMPGIPMVVLHTGRFELTKPILLMLAFSVLMLVASVSMISKKQNIVAAGKVNYPKLVIQGMLTGIVTGFVSVGGGFLIIPTLVLFADLPMKKAVGTSLMIMTISSLLGVLGDVSRHEVINYPFLVIFSTFAIAGVIAGSYLSRHIKEAWLKPFFGWFVMATGVFILISTLFDN